MPRIFVNYRTGDGEFAAAMLDLHLAAVFGADSTFLASRTIAPGQDFAREILGRLAGCTVVLAVVGRRWHTAADGAGRRRLDLPGDWVRRELAEAFGRGIAVIPVLLDDTPRLAEDGLPADVAALGRCQYVRLRHRHAGPDLDGIVAALRAADAQMSPLLETDLRAYLNALATAMTATQSWLPYRTMDSAYLDRTVMVHGEAPPGPPDEGLYQDGHPPRHAEVSWAQACRQVPIGVVLGDAGLGKTWLLRRHCLELCRVAAVRLAEGGAADEVPVPLFVHAQQLAGGPGEWSTAEVVADAALSGLDVALTDRTRLRGFLAARLDPGRAPVHLLVDALDEVFADEARDRVLARLRWVGDRVRADRGPRLLLSSRVAGFTDPFHHDENADGDERGGVPAPRYFQLGGLAEHQVRRLWALWFELRGAEVPVDRLEPVLAPGSAVRAAVRTPLVAAFAAWVAESESVTPNRSGLYGQVVDRFLGLHWKGDGPGLFRSLRGDAGARVRFRRAFTDLAWHMALAGPTWRDAVSVEDCEEVLGAAFPPAGGDRSRTFDALRGFGILVRLGVTTEPDTPTVAWVHRSVHEFLVARRLVDQPAERVGQLIAQRCWFRQEWANVLDFAIGIETGDGGGGTVSDAVRRAALSDEDGLGWFATVFTSAAAGMPTAQDDRGPVVERVRKLYRAGVLTVRHLVRVLALTPEAQPDELARLVLTTGDPGGGGHEMWTALAWCGRPGIAALRSSVVHSPVAAGAAVALRDVAPGEAVAAVAERLAGGLPVHPEDAPVLRDLPAEAVARLRAAYGRRPSSAALARGVGWTRAPAGRADLVANVTAAEPAVRRAAAEGLVAGFGAELDVAGADLLLEVASHDEDPGIRLLVREALYEIATDVPWVRRLLDDHHEQLYRDLPGRIEDLASLVGRLLAPGPGTDLALAMLREEPDLVAGDVATAMAALTAKAMDGLLTEQQIEHVAAIVGADFTELVRGRFDGSVCLPGDQLRRLVTGLLRAAPADPEVFDMICDLVGRQPDPVLGVALRLHDMAGADKVERLVARLLRADQPRPSVRVWTDVLWATMLELPWAARATLRDVGAEVTRRLLDTLD